MPEQPPVEAIEHVSKLPKPEVAVVWPTVRLSLLGLGLALKLFGLERT
jgi:hypothetical protein